MYFSYQFISLSKHLVNYCSNKLKIISTGLHLGKFGKNMQVFTLWDITAKDEEANELN